MAKIEQGILGPFRGTVGTVVGYMWRDRWCMRSRPREYHDRQSEAQLLQRGRFKAMIRFASPATPLLRIGLRRVAQERQLTEGNCFLQLNNDAFGSGSVDYARLRFSRGHLPAVRLTEAAVDEGGVATVQWSKEGGRNEDRVHLYAYSAASGMGLVVATVERGRRRASFLLPEQMAGAEVHLWAVAENQHGEVSETAYRLLCGEGAAAQSYDRNSTATNPGTDNHSNLCPAAPYTPDIDSRHAPPGPLPPGELGKETQVY